MSCDLEPQLFHEEVLRNQSSEDTKRGRRGVSSRAENGKTRKQKL